MTTQTLSILPLLLYPVSSPYGAAHRNKDRSDTTDTRPYKTERGKIPTETCIEAEKTTTDLTHQTDQKRLKQTQGESRDRTTFSSYVSFKPINGKDVSNDTKNRFVRGPGTFRDWGRKGPEQT